jgi:hypothetical protein
LVDEGQDTLAERLVQREGDAGSWEEDYWVREW